MGTINISDSLFTKTQQRVLGLFFLQPDRSFYINEVVRFANTGKGAVQRELVKLESSGILVSTHIGNQRHFQANQRSPVFDDLRALIIKTFGIQEVIANCLQPNATKIKLAFVFGSIAKGSYSSQSDVDLMIVSDDLDFKQLFDLLLPAEKLLGRPVNPTLYRSAEFEQKAHSEFLQRIFKSPTIQILGSLDEYK